MTIEIRVDSTIWMSSVSIHVMDSSSIFIKFQVLAGVAHYAPVLCMMNWEIDAMLAFFMLLMQLV